MLPPLWLANGWSTGQHLAARGGIDVPSADVAYSSMRESPSLFV